MNKLLGVCLVGLLLSVVVGCSAQCGALDLTLVLDSSAQVGSNEFHSEVQLCLTLALKIGLSNSAVNVAGIVYSSTFNTQVFLPFTGSEVTAALALNNLTYLGNGSAPGTALYYAINLNQNHKRAAVPQALLFISGSYGNQGFDVMTEASKLKNNGVQIFALGADNCDQNTLQNIVSNSNNFWYSSNFNQALNNNLGDILNSLCALSPSTSGSTSPYTTTQGSIVCGNNNCAPGAQCCSDDAHAGSDYYCCAGTATCCHGACCTSTQYCDSTGSSGTCTNGGAGSTTMNPYTTTGNSQTCGNNLCAPNAQCCSDDAHAGSDYYCCAGDYTCCRGSCCRPGSQCNSNGVCSGSSSSSGFGFL